MRFIKLEEVKEKTGLSRSAIYRKMNDDTFPKSFNLGDRAVAWLESEVALLRNSIELNQELTI
ncbi:AlpA family transcriptional regulator [Vibrio alfacsensis]|uniref:AlpA family transcriptional regulator n=1 Tax=Vibrio alfacsensis TaxID=1074311 RepID=UPI004068C0D1